MLLALDIGNTNVTAGVFEGDLLRTHFRLSSDSGRTPDEYAAIMAGLLAMRGLDLKSIDAAIVSSVVPALNPVFGEIFGERVGGLTPRFIDSSNCGLRVGVEEPTKVGVDRLVNAFAAHRLHNRQSIVVDFGTAITFDCVDGSGVFLGGAIAPGIRTASSALFDRAASISRPLARLSSATGPCRAIGRSTEEALRSGIILGFASLVDGLVERMRTELGGRTLVIATGGMADDVSKECKSIDVVDRLLTLKGLRLLHEDNR